MKLRITPANRTIQRSAWLATMILVCGTSANADTISYSGGVSQKNTNWAQVINIPMFNPALGTLNSIQFALSGHMQSTRRGENLDDNTQTSVFSGSITESLKRPDNSSLVQLTPWAWSLSKTLTGFDGTIDFGGTSGFIDVATLDRSSTFLTALPSDLALFTGIGTVSLSADATANSNISSSGNVIGAVGTQASSDIGVTYDYTPTPAVPEPLTVVGLFLGIGTLSTYVRRRLRESFLATL